MLIISVAATAVFSWQLYAQGSGKPEAHIDTPGGSFVYPMDDGRVVDAHGPLGTSHIRVGPGGVSFADSPCANQLCVHSGTISRPGTWAACLPNRVFVRITGQSEAQIDAATW
jgi:hypothetical protein